MQISNTVKRIIKFIDVDNTFGDTENSNLDFSQLIRDSLRQSTQIDSSSVIIDKTE